MGDVIAFPLVVPSKAASPEVRAALENAAQAALDAAEHIIATLDRLDGDPDLEPNGDNEPSLGAPVGGDSQVPWAAGSDSDLERALHRLGRACRAIPSPEPMP